MMKAVDVLKRAAELVGGDRNRQHGDLRMNHQAIAELWNGYLKAREASQAGGAALEAEDVANMMELLKVARRLNGDFNADDFIDAAGYAAIAGQLSVPSP